MTARRSRQSCHGARRCRARRRGSRPRSTSSRRTSTPSSSSPASTPTSTPAASSAISSRHGTAAPIPWSCSRSSTCSTMRTSSPRRRRSPWASPCCPVSNVTGDGIEELRSRLRARQTFVLLGSSGVGKSTLVNRLAGRRLMPTGDLRNDGRGRHTTRHRQLLVLPNGALLVDTPGLRELQVWEGDVDSAFADIAEIASTVPVQRLRARDGAGLRDPRGARERRARPRALGELPQAPAGASCRSTGARARGSTASSSSGGGREPVKRVAPAATEASPRDPPLLLEARDPVGRRPASAAS